MSDKRQVEDTVELTDYERALQEAEEIDVETLEATAEHAAFLLTDAYQRGLSQSTFRR